MNINEFDLNAMPDFDASMGALNAQHQQQEEEAQIFDDRIIRFKAGHNYCVALTWPVDPYGRRQSPFICRVTHGDYGQGRSGREVTCPTSLYVSGKAGFKYCKACAEVNKYYKDYEKTKSEVSKELYRHFKRQNRHYALVYVISDDLTPENNGKFMIMRMPIRISDYLHRKIFGWATKKNETPLPQAAVVGKKALTVDGQWNVLVTVSTESTESGTFNSYNTELIPRNEPLPITQADINKAGLELKFDEDFFIPYDAAETDKFVKEVMLQANLDVENSGSVSGGGVFDPSDLSQFDPNKPAIPPAVSKAAADISAAPKAEIKAPASPVPEAAPAAGGPRLEDILAELEGN